MEIVKDILLVMLGGTLGIITLSILQVGAQADRKLKK